MLEHTFALRARSATVSTEVLAGVTTFKVMAYINLGDFDEGFPALATMLAMPLTYSSTNGIGAGMLTYTFIKIVRGKIHELSSALLIVALAFLVYFVEPWLVQVLAF